MRIFRLRPWLMRIGCSAIVIATVSWICLRSPASPDQKAISAAENEVYEAVVRELVNPEPGQPRISQLVFSDSIDHFLCPGVDKDTCEQGVRKRLRTAADGTLSPTTVEDFIRKSRTEGPISATFHTDLPHAFIAPNTVYFDIEPIQKNGERPFGQVFPGAGGIISLSHAGFDSSLREAIVSSTFICGSLCGTGRRHILRKKWGRWVVVESWIVWVS